MYTDKQMLKVHTERFWSNVDKEGPNSCWIWKGSVNSMGHGQMLFMRRNITAHRVSWIINVGPIPKRKCILHHCDNRLCVNPAHLYVGTQSDNNRDRAHRNPTGQGGRFTKVPDIEIERIRNMSRNYSQAFLSRLFNYHPSTISRIINKR
uniref:Putative homing endonuclease n=1 Tax=viral metagenome TaxID=1070528 RepID=A0A6M3IM37_9ZZZZ